MKIKPLKYLKTWELSIVRERATLREALAAIMKSGCLMATIVDSERSLKGIICDSDVRKALLQGAKLTDLAFKWAQKQPLTAPASWSASELKRIATEVGVRDIPILDSKGRLVDIYLAVIAERKEELARPGQINSVKRILPNKMFIFAGGLGLRLRSVVSDRPKPLAPVGDAPIIDNIISSALAGGIRGFYIATNYLGDMIERHIGQSQFRHLDIKFVKESRRLGTAGAIGLIKNEVTESLLVINGDILTDANFSEMIASHEKQSADITCAVKVTETVVPFGVVELRKGKIADIREKPRLRHLTLSGIYVLSPKVCQYLRKNSRMDMPDLIQKVLSSSGSVYPYFLNKYWLDIGRPEDLIKANEDFVDLIKNKAG